MFFELVVLLFVMLWIYRKKKRQHLDKLSRQLKINLRSLPFIGHSYLLAGSEEQRMKGFQKIGLAAIESGGTSSIWHADNLYIIVADPEVAEIVMKSCLEKDDILNIFRIVTGDGSIFTTVSKWRPRRKLLAPTFNMKNLNRFVNVFSEQSRVLADKLTNMSGREPCSMWDPLCTYSMDAVCETTLGIKLAAKDNSDQSFREALDILFTYAATMVCRPWLQINAILTRLPYYPLILQKRTLVYDFVDEIIRKKKKEKENVHQDPESVASMLELMLDFTDVDMPFIREECIVFLGAGTDTTAVGMGYTFLMLANHPDVQEKVYKELLEVIGDSDRPVKAEDIHRFKYLDAVIKETLRLYPPVPIIARKVTKDVLLPSGINLLTGCGLVINIWAIHRNPRYWGADADQFRPERFLDSPLKHPAAFMPFSYGPRNCLGYQYAMMSMKTVLATMLRRYRLTARYQIPLRVKYDLMMRHVDGYRVGLQLRT